LLNSFSHFSTTSTAATMSIVLLVVAGFHRVLRRKLQTKLNWIRLFY